MAVSLCSGKRGRERERERERENDREAKRGEKKERQRKKFISALFYCQFTTQKMYLASISLVARKLMAQTTSRNAKMGRDWRWGNGEVEVVSDPVMAKKRGWCSSEKW